MTRKADVLIFTRPPTGSQSRTAVLSVDNPAACILVQVDDVGCVGVVAVVEVPALEAGKCNGVEVIRV